MQIKELLDEEMLPPSREICVLLIEAQKRYRRYLETHKYYDMCSGTNLMKKEGLLPLIVYYFVLDKLYFP